MSIFRYIHGLGAVLGAILLSGCAGFQLNTHAKDQERAKIYLQRAAEQFDAKDYPKAMDSVLESLKHNPQLAPAYNHLALIFMETKRYPKAEEAFKKALSVQPEYPEVFNNIGVLYNRMERYEEAVPYFQKALNDDRYITPENAYTNLGHSYLKLGNLARAKAYHQKALDISPQFCLAAKNMGDVYAKEKNFPKSAEYYQKAATNCPLFQETQYKLGLVLMKMGQRSVAKTEFERLIERHKTGPYVDRSNEVLKYLH